MKKLTKVNNKKKKKEKEKELELNIGLRIFLKRILPKYIKYVYKEFDFPKYKNEFPFHYEDCKYARKILRKLKSYYWGK